MGIWDFTNILAKQCLENSLEYRVTTAHVLHSFPSLTSPPCQIGQFQREGNDMESATGSITNNTSTIINRDIGKGRFIPGDLMALHGKAFSVRTRDKIKEKGGRYSDHRRKRGKCQECKQNTSWKCSTCGGWVCTYEASHQRDCFNVHKEHNINVEYTRIWELRKIT